MEEDLRYPIGKFEYKGVSTVPQREQFIHAIAQTPSRMRSAVDALNQEQLSTPYRPGGWNVRQVVHHVPDSHLNAYTRFRLALTEDDPTIRAYKEDRWAELADSKNAPLDYSLDLLEALHKRWVFMLESLNNEEWQRTFRHPELGLVTLDRNLALYAWHGTHHVAQVESLRKRMNW